MIQKDGVTDAPAPAIDSRESSLSDFLHIPSADLFAKADAFAGFLRDGRARGFEAYLRPVLSSAGARAVVGGQDDLGEHEVIVFCSADYLGLARDVRVISASREAISRFGASVSSVPLIAGSTAMHRTLEAKLAAFVGTEAAVLFPTGHAANVGLIAALCGARDFLVLDKLVHASILDGARLSAAKWMSFRHSDPKDLERVLQRCRRREHADGILVVVEGVYGIDGDVAPIEELCRVAERYGARVMVDDAHATGVTGADGSGSATGAPRPPVIMGSLSKSLGSMGGWIATTGNVADYLRYYARTIAFSVGLPPSSVGAALKSLDLLQSGDAMGRMRENATYFRKGLVELGAANAAASGSAIMSIQVGDEATLRDASRVLFRRGVWAEGLPFPAVPRGQERVRFRVTADHTREDLDRSLEIVGDTLRALDVLPRARRSTAAPTGLAVGASASPGKARDVEVLAARDRSALQQVVQLAIGTAILRRYPVPWVHPDQYVAVLEGRGAWGDGVELQTFVARRAGAPVATATAGVKTVGEGKPQAFIGHVHWAPEEESALEAALSAALDWLRARGVGEILAPLQPPLQFLGGGVGPAVRPSSFPLLQPQTAPELGRCLGSLGFSPAGSMPYVRVGLDAAIAAYPALEEGTGVVVRAADRTRFSDELRRILPIINATISRLPFCSSLSLGTFQGIANEIRDLILPDLWLIAERGGEVVGFVGGFPDVNAALLESGGGGGTADIERLGWAMSEAKRGSIAWLAVAPPHGGKGLGEQLIGELCRRMRARGFSETWLHWELVDGDRTGPALFPAVGVVERIEYSLFSGAAGRAG